MSESFLPSFLQINVIIMHYFLQVFHMKLTNLLKAKLIRRVSKNAIVHSVAWALSRLGTQALGTQSPHPPNLCEPSLNIND